MKEKWKPVVGFEEVLAVSTLGNVIVTPRVDANGFYHPEKVKRVYTHHSGYKYILQYVDGKQKFILLHRIVAEAFIPNTHNLPEVNHKDLDKGNCAVYNLEWCTRKENMAHAVEAGAFNTPKMANRNSKPSTKPTRYAIDPKRVASIHKDGTRVEHDSVNACARYIGGYSTNISACLKGKFNTYKGYTFEYL